MILSELSKAVKSNNAGATFLTFDILFHTLEDLVRAKSSRALDPACIGELYGVATEEVRVFAFEPTLTIKITIPRRFASGGVEERDFDGVQQFAPLLDLVVD